MHSPEGETLKGVSLRVFPNFRRTHECENLPLHKKNFLFISSLLSHFIENKYFHRNVGTYKIAGAPPT
jgi:hypothetical protein